MLHYLMSFTYSRIWLKLVFLPSVSLHAAPIQKRVLPASFACRKRIIRSRKKNGTTRTRHTKKRNVWSEYI